MSDQLSDAAHAIAHIAGCDNPSALLGLCDIAQSIDLGYDNCECVNMARSALSAVASQRATNAEVGEPVVTWCFTEGKEAYLSCRSLGHETEILFRAVAGPT